MGKALRVVLFACAVLASGCAIVPEGGRVSSATIAQKGGQQDVFVQLIPAAPEPGWGPGLIVSGFILASASFAGDHAVAREYLTPSAARSWHPGSSVLEFADAPSVTTVGVQTNSVTLQVSGKLLGMISDNGQYQAAEVGVSPDTRTFTVVKVAGQWRIANPPDQLLLSRSDVARTFRSRNLYYYNPSMSVLVPDPVYMPAEATSADLVDHLAGALRQGPQGWLAGGTTTAFPPGTRVLRTAVDGSTAIVNLGGRAAAAAGAQQRDQMAVQLLQTLASPPPFPSDVPPQIQSVVFEINGVPVRSSCATGNPPVLQLSLCGGPVPTPGSRAYYVDNKGRVATISGQRADTPVPGPAGTGELPLDRIAVSPDQMNLAGVSGGVLYTGSFTQDGALTRRLVVASISSLSWDSAGGLWVVGSSGGRSRVWRLGPQPVEVRLPARLGPVSALRVAPDGVRVAMITGSGRSSRLWLAAISRYQQAIGTPVPIGTDISHLSDMAWYDTGDLIVLTQPPSGSALYEVPADGGQSRQIATEPNTVSITASVAASGSGLVAARSNGVIMQLPNPFGSIWQPAGTGPVLGRSPVYPG